MRRKPSIRPMSKIIDERTKMLDIEIKSRPKLTRHTGAGCRISKDAPPSPILAQLEDLRIERGLTRRELARRAGISPQTAQDAIRTGRGHLSTAEALADALGLKLNLELK